MPAENQTVALCNASLNHYRSVIRELQNNSRITWDLIGREETFDFNRPGVTRVFQHYDMCPPGATEFGCKTPQGSGLTNLKWIKSRFDKALYYHKQNPDNYHYGVYLLVEEVWHPSLEVLWGERKIMNWIIDDSLTLPNGSLLELLKPWIIRTYGSWNQVWFDSIKTSNNCQDPKIAAWSEYYGYTLMKEWHEFMRSLGKKSAIMGLAGFSSMNLREEIHWYFPGKMFDYLIQNYDFVTTGIHPNRLSETSADIEWLKILRNEWNYNGIICHMIPSCWSDGWGCPFDIITAEEDFKQAVQYVDVIAFTPFADNSDWSIPDAELNNPIHIKYIPLAITWADKYTLTPDNNCPTLQNGSSGDTVKTLQSALISKGFNPGPVDGIFGPVTEAAVKAFKTSVGLTVNGIVDVQTWTALGVNCNTPCLPSQCNFKITQ